MHKYIVPKTFSVLRKAFWKVVAFTSNLLQKESFYHSCKFFSKVGIYHFLRPGTETFCFGIHKCEKQKTTCKKSTRQKYQHQKEQKKIQRFCWMIWRCCKLLAIQLKGGCHLLFRFFYEKVDDIPLSQSFLSRLSWLWSLWRSSLKLCTCGCNLTRPLGGSIKDHLLGLLEVLIVLGIGDAIDIPKLQHQNAIHNSCKVSAFKTLTRDRLGISWL